MTIRVLIHIHLEAVMSAGFSTWGISGELRGCACSSVVHVRESAIIQCRKLTHVNSHQKYVTSQMSATLFTENPVFLFLSWQKDGEVSSSGVVSTVHFSVIHCPQVFTRWVKKQPQSTHSPTHGWPNNMQSGMTEQNISLFPFAHFFLSANSKLI